MPLSEKRSSSFHRNELLEQLLHELNADLQPAEQAVCQRYQDVCHLPRHLILVMGALRSGTTLFMQWLANTGLVAYPTNLLSRFYKAPVVGAKIQLLLTDPRYSFRDELEQFSQHSDYHSENGKTRGALAPNEFWYFWRRFLAEPERDVWSDEELEKTMDTRTMISELIGIMEVFNKPFLAKAGLFNYNISFLDRIFDKLLFVHVRRDLSSNAAAVLDARRRQSGSEAIWYSFEIPEYQQLRLLDPLSQARGQVAAINQAVERGLSQVADSRQMVVHYEDFCHHPERVFMELAGKLGIHGARYHGPPSFTPTR